MKFSLPNDVTVGLVGDPHLGRKFETGVPLARRGERERRQMQNFRDQLDQDVDMVVVVGDVFDHPHVGYKVVLEAYEAIRMAATADDRRMFCIMAGNHDLPRNLETIGAFETLTALLDTIDNVVVVTVPTVLNDVAMFPWEWDRTAEEQVKDVEAFTVGAAIGHWDLVSFGGDESHMAPTNSLIGTFEEGLLIYSGHYHLPGEYMVDGYPVTCTGSMEPYTHAEDPEGTLYVTMTLEELEAVDTATLTNKCVRILLAEGEEMPTDLNCLALTAKRTRNETTPTDISVDFDWNNILAEKLASLEPHVRDFITTRLGDNYDSQQ